MAKQTLSSDIRHYALAGAQARLTEISLELEAIRRAFPELRANGSSARTRQSARTAGDEPTTDAKRRRRRTMTAAQRTAVGERMKKYWAARRGGSEGSTAAANGSDSTEKASKAAQGAVKRGPRNISPEARKRISDAQKARWAKHRGEAKAADAPAASKVAATVKGRRAGKRALERGAKRGPRKMSAAARKRISQAQKKRWAAKRKAA